MERISRWFRRVRKSSENVQGRIDRRRRSADEACSIRPGVESLESRELLSTLAINGGIANYSAGAGVANGLTISLAAGTYTFSDSAEVIAAGAGAEGCVGGGTNIVTCPDSLVGGIGIDLGDMNDSLSLNAVGGPVTANGGLGDDTLVAGGSVGVALFGGADNDSITGGSGSDSLDGGIGNDAIFGADGGDVISGGVGNDMIDGGDGTDRIVETADADFVLTPTSLAGVGADTLAGIEQANLTGGAANNHIDATAFAGNVTLDGGAGNDLLEGGAGADRLIGGLDHDTLLGGTGNDNLVGGLGNDSLAGGGGTDMADFGASDHGVAVNLRRGAAAGEGRDRLSSVENVTGSPFSDAIVGDNLANMLLGGGAPDRLTGMGGDDTLGGDAGDDRLDGGLGNDAMLGGAGEDFLNGQAGRDILIGGTERDRLLGTAGDDILIGGTTDHDASDAALQAILAEWSSARDYVTRVANLRSGSGSVNRLNGPSFFSGATVHDDAKGDTLTGAADADWFFACLAQGIRGDAAVDVQPAESNHNVCGG